MEILGAVYEAECNNCKYITFLNCHFKKLVICSLKRTAV